MEPEATQPQPTEVTQSTQPVSNPATETTTTPSIPLSNNSSRKKMMIIGGTLLLLVIIFSFFASIAYGAVSIGTKDFRTAITKTIISIPFMPKTPEFLAIVSSEALERTKNLDFDASFAISSNELTQMLGTSTFEASAKGSINYADQNNPEVAMNLSFTKDFNADITVKEKNIVYMKLNKFPEIAKSYLLAYGIDETVMDYFMNKWIRIDSQTLETEASQNLKDKKALENPFSKTLAVYQGDQVKKHTTLTTETLGTSRVYKVHINVTKEVLDELEKAMKTSSDYESSYQKPLSSYISDMTIDGYYDANTYLTNKAVINFTIKSNNSSTSLIPSPTDIYATSPQISSPIQVSAVINLSNYDRAQQIVTPSDAVKFEDALKEIISQKQKATTTLPKSRSSQYQYAPSF